MEKNREAVASKIEEALYRLDQLESDLQDALDFCQKEDPEEELSGCSHRGQGRFKIEFTTIEGKQISATKCASCRLVIGWNEVVGATA